uniref:Uncharacterized protein n=1 Tax=Aster yellows phytoplasma TaxID=35779 RepID=Q849B6_ASTYP|nr:hypothetical protein [Aster yellows phytoplasma]
MLSYGTVLNNTTCNVANSTRPWPGVVGRDHRLRIKNQEFLFIIKRYCTLHAMDERH